MRKERVAIRCTVTVIPAQARRLTLAGLALPAL